MIDPDDDPDIRERMFMEITGLAGEWRKQDISAAVIAARLLTMACVIAEQLGVSVEVVQDNVRTCYGVNPATRPFAKA